MNSEPPPILPGSVTHEPTPPAGRLRWTLHLLLLSGYIGVVGFSGLFRDGVTGPALGNNSQHLLSVSAEQLAIFSVIFGIAWLFSKATPSDLWLHWRPGVWVLPLGLGYSIALRFAVGIIIALTSAILLLLGLVSQESLTRFASANRPEVEVLVDIDALRNDPLYFWLTTTLVSFVVAGLREELWRAGFVAGLQRIWPGAFAGNRGQVAAVGLAAVIFGLAHAAQGIIAVAMTGFIGLGLGLIMLVHRSIWPAVLAHGFFNATSFILLPWAMDMMRTAT